MLPHLGSRWSTRRWPRIALGAVLAVVLMGCTAAFLVAHDSPRGLVNFVPLPRGVRPLTQVDGLNYRIHVGLGTLFEDVGAPTSATAAEWFKGAYHARTESQLAHVANGLIAVQQRSSRAEVEAALCPALRSATVEGNVGRAARQAEALRMAGMACDASATQ